METLAYVREKGGKKILKLRRLKKKADYVWATEGFPPHTGQSFTGRGVGTRRRAFTAAAGNGTVVHKRNVSNTVRFV